MEDRGLESAPILAKMKVPTSVELFCFTATVDRREEKDPSAKSDFHWQTIKCRMLLFATASVLVCPVRPVSGPRRELTVVCRREDIADVPSPEDDTHPDTAAAPPPPSELVGILARLRLAVSRLRPVSDPEYSACLRYTLTAKLSPLWNPLGEDEDRLVKGKDFLGADRGRPVEAVRLEVNVHGELGAAWLSFSVARLRIAPLDFADLDVSSTALERFHQDPLAVVPSVCIGQPWVRVLPSLKKGMVMEISRTLPEHCPFSSYKNIRRHWKNMYGYRLAEDPTEVLYVSIYFSMLGGNPMSYPLPCLTPRAPTVLRSLDPRAVAVAFLGDVATRLPMVCCSPSPVAVDGLVRPVAALQSAGDLDSDSDGPASAQPNLRPLAENANGYSSSSSAATPPRDGDSTPSTCPLSLATQPDGTRPRVEWNVLKRAPRGQDNKENVPPGDDLPRPAAHRPVFGARPPVRVQARRATPVPPGLWFNPAAASTPTRAPASPATTSSSAVPCSSTASEATGLSPDTPPSSTSASTANTAASALPYAPVFRVPANKPIFLSLPKATAKKAPAKKAAAPGPRPRPGLGCTSPRLGAVAPGEASSPQPSGASRAVGPRLQQVAAGAPGTPPAPPAPPAPPGPARTSASPSTTRKTGAAGKRSSSEAPLVPELTTADAARRASIPMLLAWLRNRGVPCRVKDKKAELVEKVVAQLGAR